jgi:hypothetical protein
MAATQSEVSGSANVHGVIAARLDEMDQLVEAGDWQKIEAVLKRLPQLMLHVPVSERRDVLLAARSKVEQVRERVLQQSHAVGERLSTIKTGRQAAASYQLTSSMTSG